LLFLITIIFTGIESFIGKKVPCGHYNIAKYILDKVATLLGRAAALCFSNWSYGVTSFSWNLE